MLIQITNLSKLSVSVNVEGSSLVASGGVKDNDQGGLDSKTGMRKPSESPYNWAFASKDYQHLQWIAGVGDLVGPCVWTDNPPRHIAVCKESRASQTYHYSSKIAMPNSRKLDEFVPLQHEGSRHRTTLQRHCDFWDTDGDGLIYPWDIYEGFRKLGFHFSLCLWAAVTIAICASYNTHTSYIPHPLFAINLNNINSNRHGSSTGAYDMDGELDERRFEAIFQKYARGKDYLTLWSMYRVWRNQRCGLDFFGWFAGGLEWIAMYVLLWPEDGLMSKADVRGVFDGSIFYTIAERRRKASS